MAYSKAVFDIVRLFDPDGSSRPGPGKDGNPDRVVPARKGTVVVV
jgi:hypothetical protein